MSTHTPPAAAVRLLKRCLSPAAFEIVAGDLEEAFQRGRGHAWFWWHTLRSIAAHWLGRTLANAASFATDLRLAARALARQRRLTGVAVTTLGLSVALCVAVLAAVNAYLVRGLPYPESDRLYNVTLSQPGIDLPPNLERLDWRSLGDVVELSIAWDLDAFNLTGAPYPQSAQGTWVTPDYMAGFGVRVAQGRVFEPSDYAPDSPPVAIISHSLWQTRFGADPAIVGRRFESYSLDRPEDIGMFTIIGVLPDNHWHIQQAFTEVMAPLKADTSPYLVRLRPGVSASSVADRIKALISASHTMPERWRPTVVSALDQYVVSVRPLLMTVASAAGLVLLIAGANVSVLLLVRANERRQEMGVRRALGASGLRLARVIVAEAIVLGGAASAVGVSLAAAVVSGMAPLAERQLGRAIPGGISALQLDGVVWTGAAAAGAIIVLLCSVIPMWAAVRGSTTQANGQRGTATTRTQHRARMGLVVVEIGACLALLVGAGLMVQSGLRILNTDLGLTTDGVLTTRIGLNQSAYRDASSRVGFLMRAEEARADMAGVSGLAFGTSWPLQTAPEREMRPVARPDAAAGRAGLLAVSAGYFDVLGIPRLSGRNFDARDQIGRPLVAIASRTLAERLWPGQDPIGQHVSVAPTLQARPGTPTTIFEIVGTVGDTRHSHSDTNTADLFVALNQFGAAGAFVYLRTDGRDTAVLDAFRTTLARIDQGVVTGSARPMTDIVDQQRAGSRFLAQLLIAFSIVAAALALVGVHGVIAYAVTLRRGEVAVRMAIGATSRHITALFLRQGALMVTLGLALGTIGAIGMGRLLESQLFGTTATDVTTISVAGVGFGLAALVASLMPARSAAAADPATALKGE